MPLVQAGFYPGKLKLQVQFAAKFHDLNVILYQQIYRVTLLSLVCLGVAFSGTESATLEWRNARIQHCFLFL